jgi:hypothetical protein
MKDFFEYENHNELLVIKEFKKLKEENPDYSNVMWFIYFVYSYDSYYMELGLEDRISLIEENLFEKGWYQRNRTIVTVLANAFQKTQETAMRKFLASVVNLAHKRQMFMDTVPYDSENAKKLDDMLLATPKIIEMEKEVKKKLSAYGDKRIKGAQTLSLLELKRLRTDITPNEK